MMAVVTATKMEMFSEIGSGLLDLLFELDVFRVTHCAVLSLARLRTKETHWWDVPK